MKRSNSPFRIGIGYDIHPLVEGRPLVLGGVRIEHGKGLAGHSDADALIHALADALLGAANLGDLGKHFPETDEWRGAASTTILSRVAAMVAEKGFRLVNADCIVNAEEPKLAPHRAAMAAAIAAALGVDPADISIKATRGEGLGPIGEKRAIAAEAVVLLEKSA
jgi:2-C-methyl-D-erythritol 2,4-cyclodiphosphate synthase